MKNVNFHSCIKIDHKIWFVSVEGYLMNFDTNTYQLEIIIPNNLSELRIKSVIDNMISIGNMIYFVERYGSKIYEYNQLTNISCQTKKDKTTRRVITCMSLPYNSVVDHTIMLNFIENILCHFESCFSRKAAFRWFVIITIGLMLRSDKLGVTSIMRDLALAPGCYESMLHFFRAPSWALEDVRRRWFSAVRQYAPLYKEENFHVLVGDGVKQSKEGRRMPGVKKLFQESENSAKPEYIHGHMFGGLGILAGSVRNWACIPLSLRLHDGLQATIRWKGASVSAASHVVQMVEDAYRAALTFGGSLLLLDRYFLTVPALEKLKTLNSSGDVRMEIVTKAKKSCTAFQKPGPRKPGRGRPPKKGASVHLKELFVSHKEQFQETEVELDPFYESS